MAFVSKSCIEEWFTTDSWVYKNFSYMFKNPIWNKRIPSGFSLCPYFWIALFSMCVFRPFFVPTIQVSAWIVCKGFTPLRVIDRWINKTLDLGAPVGVGLFIGLILLFVTGCVGAFTGLLVGAYFRYIHPTPLATCCFWYGFVNLVAICTTGIYGRVHRRDANPCPVKWYSAVIFIASTIAFYVLDSEAVVGGVATIGESVAALGNALMGGVILIFKGIFIGLGWIAAGIWFVLKVICLYIAGLTIIGLPLLAWCGITLLVGGALGKLMTSKDTIIRRSNPTKSNADDWRDLFISVIANDRHSMPYKSEIATALNGCIRKLPEDYKWSYATRQMERTVIAFILRSIRIPKSFMEIEFHKFLKLRRQMLKGSSGLSLLHMPYTYKGLFKLVETDIRDFLRDIDIIDTKARDLLCNTYSKRKTFEKKVRTVFNKQLKADLIIRIDLRNAMREVSIQKEKVKKARSTRLATMCHLISDPIANCFSSLGIIIRAVVWTFMIKGTWKAVCKTLKFLKIFIVYMWTVSKSLKHGACPYMTFTET